MAYYLDITLLANAEINAGFLLSKLYQQLHLLLVQHKTAEGYSQIGFAFPEYALCTRNDKGKITESSTLGSKLRVFALEQQSIAQLKLSEHLQKYGLLDYLHLTAIRACPKTDKLHRFSRFRYKENINALARRYAKRHSNISEDQALAHYVGLKTKPIDLPYVNLISKSNDRRKYVMYIQRSEIEAPATEAKFNTFGLTINGGMPAFA
jgi:CRISPR-associated endonuclease Csy4